MSRHLVTPAFLVSFLAGLSLPALAGPKVGEAPPAVSIAGDDGGRVDGSGWSSDTIKGKIWTLFYVDPDRSDANEELETALKAAEFPKEKYGSIAVVNMEATWKPNAIIKSILSGKQEKYPYTVYVMDKKKVLVDKWKMTDDEYDVLAFDRDGKVIFAKDGAFTPEETKAFVEMIRKAIGGA